MAKKGMKRPERTHTKPRNEVAPVPELQGKAKHTKEKANPIIEGTTDVPLKVYHDSSHGKKATISGAYGGLDSDLAEDNLANDLPAIERADL